MLKSSESSSFYHNFNNFQKCKTFFRLPVSHYFPRKDSLLSSIVFFPIATILKFWYCCFRKLYQNHKAVSEQAHFAISSNIDVNSHKGCKIKYSPTIIISTWDNCEEEAVISNFLIKEDFVVFCIVPLKCTTVLPS